MNKRKVRCYTAYVEAGGIYNNEVLYLAQEGYKLQLMTCINCGELFVVDLENPESQGLAIAQIAGRNICPKCKTPLINSMRNYPETFVGRNHVIGSFIPSSWIPPSEESKIIELWEIELEN